MDRDQLRMLQAPLKERYKTEPDAALITLSATGELGDGVICSVQTGRAIAELETDADDDKLATLKQLTERYCVVYQTLAGGPALATAVSAVSAPR